MSEAKWYVVHTYSGYENKVKANIDKTIETRHLEDQILEVRVPLEEVPEIRNGVEKVVPSTFFAISITSLWYWRDSHPSHAILIHFLHF